MAKNSPPITDNTASTKQVNSTNTLCEITVPMGPLPGYVVRRIDIHRMSALQSERLARIVSGLQCEKAVLENGTVVRNGMHAIQWILENVKTD